MLWIQSTLGGSVEILYKLKDVFSKKVVLLLEAILMMLICVRHAVSVGHYVDFFQSTERTKILILSEDYWKVRSHTKILLTI